VAEPDALWLHKFGHVLLVVRVQLGFRRLVRRIASGDVPQELLHHDLLQHRLDLRIPLQPAPPRFLGQKLESDQAIQELLLPV